jgi:CheY-like chemotaxis protein/predicted GNAT family acetyltransferase
MQVDVRHDPERSQFVAEANGTMSYLRYVLARETLDLVSTYVDPRVRGHHVGESLVKSALEYARENGYDVIPTCWFVDTVVRRNPQYRGAVGRRLRRPSSRGMLARTEDLHIAGMSQVQKTLKTILLVDDDPIVRAVASRLLRRSEYEVLEASSGLEALRILREPLRPVDLLLTDIIMPGLSGWDLGELVRVEFPAVRILYMSGFADDEIVRARAQLSDDNFLPKPFGFESLTRAVQTMLRPSRDGV